MRARSYEVWLAMGSAGQLQRTFAGKEHCLFDELVSAEPLLCIKDPSS